MTATTQTPPAAKASALAMYRTLVGVGLVCGLLIVVVFQGTAPIIRQNRIEARSRAVLQVLPGAVVSRAFAWTGSGFEPAAADAAGVELVFAGFDAAGSLVGVALEAQGMGYQDVVKVLYGYDPRSQTVVGLAVLDSRETPGLGDRAETDPAYVANFKALDVSLNDARDALAHEIEVVKPGTKTAAWQIDTISGATITSSAIANMIAAGAAEDVVRVAAHLDAFTAPPAPEGSSR